MSDAKHISRNFNGSVTKRMRYNKDEFRIDIYQFDKSQEQMWTTSNVTSVKNGVKKSASSYTVYQAENVLNPMVLTFSFHPQVSGTYRLELLYVNSHTGSKNFTTSVSKTLTKAQYQKISKQFIDYVISHKYVPNYLTVDNVKLDFRALLYGFATVLESSSLPSSAVFSSKKYTNVITYQNNLNNGVTVNRTDIISKAKEIKKNITKNGSVPSKVKLGNYYVSISQFAYLMAKAIISQNSTFVVVNATPTVSYIDSDVSYTVSVDGKTVENNNPTKGLDVVHSRGYTYFTVSEEQVEKYNQINGKAMEIKYSFNNSNSAFFALVLKKYSIYSADKLNSDDCELTVESFDIQQTNSLDTNTANVTLLYHHGLDDATGLNISGYLFDYRDEINISIKNNKGIINQEFGGYISNVSVEDDLTTMTLSCADRLIDLDHRTSISEIYMNSITDTTEYEEKYDYVSNCDNWSSALEFLCNYVELPMVTNVSEKNPLVTNKILKQINYGKAANHFSNLSKSNMSVTVNNTSVILRNGAKSNVYQSVRIFDDEVMNVKDKIIINDYPNIWIDYGLGEAEYKSST